MTFPPDGAARSLCLAADEALTAAAFCTGDFAEADRLFTQAQALAVRAGDWAGEAFAAQQARSHPGKVVITVA